MNQQTYDDLVSLLRLGFHWENLIQFCEALEQGNLAACLAALEYGVSSIDAHVCLSAYLYAEHIVQNFKSTPQIQPLLTQLAQERSVNSILESIQRHITDPNLIKQACKFFVTTADTAAAAQLHSVSATFLRLVNQTQECGAEELFRNTPPSTSAPVHTAEETDFEQQLAKALELSASQPQPSQVYHDDDQTIEAVLALSKLEVQMQNIETTNERLIAESSSIAQERDEGLKAAMDLRKDLEGVLSQLNEAQDKLEERSTNLSKQMADLDLINGTHAWEQMADLSKDHSVVDNDLRKVKQQRDMVQYAASELKSIDEFIAKEDLSKEEARKIHESIVGELMEKIVAGNVGSGSGKIPVTVVQELRERFGDDKEDVESNKKDVKGPLAITKGLSRRLKNFLGKKDPEKEDKVQKVQKIQKEEVKQKAGSPSKPKSSASINNRRSSLMSQLNSSTQNAKHSDNASEASHVEMPDVETKPKVKKTKKEMESFLKDIKKASAAASKPGSSPAMSAPAKPMAPPPPPPPGRGPPIGGAPPPPPPPGAGKKAGNLTRAPQVVALYQDLRKALIGASPEGKSARKQSSQGKGERRDSSVMFAELEGRSTYINAIKTDVDYYGEFIQDLAKEVTQLQASDMSGLASFVTRIDQALSLLTDERAVLKNFAWPEVKYDTMREATAAHMELTGIQSTCQNWTCGQEPSEVECSKISAYFDKIQQKIDRQAMTQESLSKKFRDQKVPWDKAILQKTKQSSLNLCKVYMKSILHDVEQLERSQPSVLRINNLLVTAVRFAFRVHQFVGGFNSDCISLFEQVSTKLKSYPSDSK